MKIICWNVNGIRALAKKGGFDWIINESPDIFCFQETKAHPEQLDEGIRNPEGYYSYFDHSKVKKGYSGVAVYTKTKPEKVEYGLGIQEFDEEGRMLALFFADFIFINCYFPNGGGGPERLDYKMRFYDEFLKYIDKYTKKGIPLVFCGDVNTAHTEIDLARPKENEKNTGFLPEERTWIDKVVGHGFTDVYRKFYPDLKNKYTWWDMKTFARERNVGWRIDYFFANKFFVDKIKSTKIHDNILGSDHCPISIDIQ
jgi:exodeoxyribonuclease-3